jgi:hypothetical protein
MHTVLLQLIQLEFTMQTQETMLDIYDMTNAEHVLYCDDCVFARHGT